VDINYSTFAKKEKKIIYHIFKKDTGISVLFDFVFASNV